MPLTNPFPAMPEFGQLRGQLEGHEDELYRVRIRGQRNDGNTSHVRFEPSRVIHLVQVHVQSTAVGKGGAAYDPAAYVTTEEVECSTFDGRIVDYEIIRDGANQFYVFLIPIVETEGGVTLLCDGVSGPDLMSFLDLGV